MDVFVITDKSKWLNATTAYGEVELLQSWEYGEFLQRVGRTILRLQTTVSGETHQLQCIVYPLTAHMPYAYAPRANLTTEALQSFLLYLRKQGYVFLRVESLDQLKSVGASYFLSQPTKNRQAQHLWLLDITAPIDDINRAFHQKTRYNIRVAERHHIRIKEKKDFSLFWQLTQQTTSRNQFLQVSESYCQTFLDQPNAYQFTAFDEETPIASALLLRYKDTVVYFFGASANRGRETMAPTLLQWHMIQWAKEAGAKYYDFLGVATPSEAGEVGSSCFHNFCWKSDHQLSGVTRFKVGFGGFVRSYPSAQDFVFSRWKYGLYKLLSIYHNRSTFT